MIDLSNFKFQDASDDGTTIGQFLMFIEAKNLWSPEEKNIYLLDHLDGPALEWSNDQLKPGHNWETNKNLLLSQYGARLKIRQKVNLRKSLRQKESESCQDFLNRCKRAQFLLTDDSIDYVFDRDILINFLLGLRPEFHENILQNDSLDSLESFFVEALKLEAMFLVKEEIMDQDEPEEIKGFAAVPVVKNEFLEPEVKVHTNEFQDDFDYYSGDDYLDYDNFDDKDDEDFQVEEKPVKKSGRKKAKKKYKAESDEDFDPSDNAGKVKSEKEDPDYDYDADHPEADKLEATLPCKYCGKMYKLQHSLDAHIANQHPTSDTAALKIKCGFCDLAFKTRRCLTCVSSAMKS